MGLHFVARDVERVGSRPAALFLHAYPFDHRMWLPVIDRLDGMPLIAVDAPGFGKSPATVDSPSLEAIADELAASIGRFGVEKVMAVGCSMGGYLALALAERHPRLISGIAMVCSRADADSSQGRGARIESLVGILAGRREEILTPAIESMFADATHRNRPDIVTKAIGWGREATREGLTWAQRSMSLRPDRLGILECLGVPGLVMRGAEDSFTTPEQAEDMATALGTKVITARSTGHLLPVEDPAALSPHLMSLYPLCK